MSYWATYDAFAPLVTAFAGTYSPALPVAYPGLDFTPPDEGVWLEIIDNRNNGTEYGVSDDGPAEAMGFFRVLVNDRPGQSTKAATQTAEALAAAIPKGTEIGPARIYQTPRADSGPIIDGNVVMHPVTFRWRATL